MTKEKNQEKMESPKQDQSQSQPQTLSMQEVLQELEESQKQLQTRISLDDVAFFKQSVLILLERIAEANEQQAAILREELELRKKK